MMLSKGLLHVSVWFCDGSSDGISMKLNGCNPWSPTPLMTFGISLEANQILGFFAAQTPEV